MQPALPPLFPTDDSEFVALPPTFRRRPARTISVELARPHSPTRRRAKRLCAGVALLLLIAAAIAGHLYLQAQSLLADLHAGPKGAVVASVRSVLGSAPPRPLVAQIAKRHKLSSKQTSALASADQKVQTVLLIGSDRRWGDTTGGRSDTIMLVRLDPHEKTISILSVPRDLKVPIPGYGEDKINAAFAYGGEKLLIETLRNYFGVRIDHFIETNFRGFMNVVDALGGVWMPVDGRYYNVNNGTAATDFANIDLLPGYQKLNATQALEYVRFRHFDSDFVRAARQQIFLREVAREVIASRWNYFEMSALLHAFADATASDIDSLGEIWHLVSIVRSTPPDRVTRALVPGTGGLEGGVYYYESADAERRAAIEQWFNPQWRIAAEAHTQNQLRRITHTAETKKGKQVGRAGSKPAATRALSTSGLSSDDGHGKSLIEELHPSFASCAPSLIPSGFWWGSDTSVRLYTIHGEPAIAGWVTAGSGDSMLLMETTWTDAPILSKPTKSLTYRGRSYDLWYESGSLRQVAWRQGGTAIWLTNTLQDTLSPQQLLGVAASCTPLAGH